MQFEPALSPYLRPSAGVGQVMRQVLYALIPAAVAYLWFFGIGLLANLVIAVGCALLTEAAVLALRRRPVRVTLGDYTAVVTGVLLAFAMPPLTPWWITAIAAAFGIGVAKHLYGGLGFNIFNPAMAGYVVVLVSFPIEMSSWISPRVGDLDFTQLSWLQSLAYIASGHLPGSLDLDAITRATPLDQVRTALAGSRTMSEARANPMFGSFGGRGWEWINVFVLIGGIWLLYRRIIRWHIPLGVLAGLLIPAIVASLIAPDSFGGPTFHLFTGATLLCAFFIATDPVSAATSPRGRLAYGFGIGFIAWMIRTWGGYPDGFSFAVLLMNMCAPTIDRFTIPRIMGHER